MWKLRQVSLALILSTLMTSWGGPAEAATCQVPTVTYSTIQSAIDDPGCTEIELAAQVFAEAATIGRSLTLRGASSSTTVVEGRIKVTGGTVDLEGLCIGVSLPTEANRYPAALSVEGGAEVNGTDLVVLQAVSTPVFSDGFESGDTSAWMRTVGS